jgi:hypothetical protein
MLELGAAWKVLNYQADQVLMGVLQAVFPGLPSVGPTVGDLVGFPAFCLLIFVTMVVKKKIQSHNVIW